MSYVHLILISLYIYWWILCFLSVTYVIHSLWFWNYIGQILFILNFKLSTFALVEFQGVNYIYFWNMDMKFKLPCWAQKRKNLYYQFEIKLPSPKKKKFEIKLWNWKNIMIKHRLSNLCFYTQNKHNKEMRTSK